MRTSFAYRDFTCGNCKRAINSLVEISPSSVEHVICDCGGRAVRQERAGKKEIRFQPFWSDTFEMRVNDREDMKKIKLLRKANGLVCVGHNRQKQDDRAVRYNYEHD